MPSGAELLLECLQREGVDVLFGYPGGVIIPFYDVLLDSPIRHVLVRHEQGAVHAAEGYAKSTGRVGVCMGTSGPGATNLVTGIADAHMDSVPLVVLTGQVPTSLIGSDAFQEADTIGITLPVCKHSYLIKDARDLPQVMAEAFHLARTGRPGPVVVDLPKDVLAARLERPGLRPIDLPGYKPTLDGHPGQIRRLLSALKESQRPVLLVGGGVIGAGAAGELQQFAERTGIPVAMTLMGLGAIPADHPLALGMVGMHGTRQANHALARCDLMIGIGVRFDDRVTGRLDRFAEQCKVAHIDVDPAEVGKNVVPDLPIVGDAKRVLSALLEEAEPLAITPWVQGLEAWARQHPLIVRDYPDMVAPQALVRMVSRITEGQAITVTDVGQHQMWTAQHYAFHHPRQLVTSGGLGTMGFGLPAAVGAQIANPGRNVVLITGDGSLQMTIQELGTLAEEELPVKIVILNNGFLGMVRQWQEMFYDRRYSAVSPKNPDFCKLAEAYGIPAVRITHPRELEEVLGRALRTPGPMLVDCRVAPESNVFPMIPAGGAIDQILDVPDVSPEPAPIA